MQKEAKLSRIRYSALFIIIFVLVVLLIRCYSAEPSTQVPQPSSSPRATRSPNIIITKVITNSPTEAFTTSKSQVQKVFENIYENKLWGEYGGGSGHGSIVSSTIQIRAKLKMFIEEHNITSMMV